MKRVVRLFSGALSAASLCFLVASVAEARTLEGECTPTCNSLQCYGTPPTVCCTVNTETGCICDCEPVNPGG